MARNVPNSRYLFRRDGSQHWQLRLRMPDGGKVIERSLGTMDVRAAELAAADDIKKHRAMMLDRRQSRVAQIIRGPWKSEYTPGLHTLPDGRSLIATATDVTFSDGTRRPNGGPEMYIAGGRVIRTPKGNQDLDLGITAAQEFAALDAIADGTAVEGPIATMRPKVQRKVASADDAALENYIRNAKWNGGRWHDVREKEARKIWDTFKSVVNKPLAECTQEDGRTLVAHLEAEHRKTRKTVIKVATLRRALASLVTVANLAKVTPNPFHKVLPKVTSENDSDDIDEYSDSDIKVIRKNLHKLCEEDRLLVRLLASTGMNRDEAFQIKKEYVLDGIRYCEIGTKSGARKRRVPFPADLLPHLPAKIDRPLFKGRQDSLTKRIGAFMSDIGVINDSDGRKISPLHSFRHRAATRIRLAYPASDELLYAIGGWARGKKNSSRTYGTFPISVLKEAIDKIGFEGQRRASRS